MSKKCSTDLFLKIVADNRMTSLITSGNTLSNIGLLQSFGITCKSSSPLPTPGPIPDVS